MIGAGTFLNPLIKVVTTVAILAAIYFLIVKPILNTTENVSKSVNDSFGRSFGGGQLQGVGDDRATELRTARDAALSGATSLRAGSQPWNEPAAEIRDCVRKAGDDLPAMKQCERLADDASDSLHDRNFATSYADSLAAQGNTSDAARVSECVEDAGYDRAKMARCQRLADQLLFG